VARKDDKAFHIRVPTFHATTFAFERMLTERVDGSNAEAAKPLYIVSGETVWDQMCQPSDENRIEAKWG
jgi:hypothetical protein